MDFIKIYDNALNQAFCDRIIQMFEHSSPKKLGVTGEAITVTAEDIPNLSDKAIAKLIARLYYMGIINAQKYEQGIGGYYHYHSEIYPAPFQKLTGNKTNNKAVINRTILAICTSKVLGSHLTVVVK